MKNYFLVLPAIFIFSFPLVAQIKPQTVDDLKAEAQTFKKSGFNRYEIRYDKATDKSSVFYVGDVLRNTISLFPANGTSIQLLTKFQFAGSALDRNIENFDLIFSVFGKQKEFSKSQNLYILADAERFDFGRGKYDGDIGAGFAPGFKMRETLTFQVTREQLEKFANAKILELKVGTRKFKLKENKRRGFANFVALGSM